jgi:extracellular matrix regulatory protein A
MKNAENFSFSPRTGNVWMNFRQKSEWNAGFSALSLILEPILAILFCSKAISTMRELLNVGFGHTVISSRIIAIVSPKSAPIKRLKEEAKQGGKLVDATSGRQTRAVVVTDSGHVVLSAVMPSTLLARLENREEAEDLDRGDLEENDEKKK